MRKTTFTEHQIISILKQKKADIKVAVIPIPLEYVSRCNGTFIEEKKGYFQKLL